MAEGQEWERWKQRERVHRSQMMDDPTVQLTAAAVVVPCTLIGS